MTTDFHNAMRSAGIDTLATIPADGKLHRFDIVGDKPKSQNGWAVLHDDPPAGAFGCWKRGINETWTGKAYQTMSAEEKGRYRANLEAARREREAEQERIHAECRKKAKQIWEASKPAPADYPYLQRKNIKPHGAKVTDDGKLIVPVRGADGTLHGLQFIDQDGTKKFTTGTAKAGSYYSIGGKPVDVLYLAEGFATAATVHEVTGKPVAVAFDAGNLKAVSETLRAKLPDVQLIVCADDDHGTEGNPGLTKATEAALAAGGLLAVPNFVGTERGPKDSDFNDLARLSGIDVVKACINVASSPATNTEAGTTPGIVSKLRRGADIKALEINVEWHLQPLIPKGAIILFFGRGGLGKSTLFIMLGGTITTGGSIFGMQATTAPVVYVDFENSLAILSKRLKDISADRVMFLTSADDPPRLDRPERNLYLDILSVHPGAVFIFDTLRSAQSGDENDSKAMSEVLGFLRLLRDRGATVIVLHHTPKSSDRKYKGSSAIFDMADHVLGLYPVKQAGDDTEADEDEDEARVFRFGTAMKTRFEPSRLFLTFNTETRRFELAPDPAEQQLADMAAVIGNIGLDAKQKDIIEAAQAEGIPQRKAHSLLNRGDGRLWTAHRGLHNAKLYSLTESGFAVLQPYIGAKNCKTEISSAEHSTKQTPEDSSQSRLDTDFCSFAGGVYKTEKQDGTDTADAMPVFDF